MKKFVRGVLFVVMVVLSSCLDDSEGYSLGNFWVELGTLEMEAGTEIIRLDDGTVLYPVAGWRSGQQLDEGARVLVDFTILGDKQHSGTYDAYYVRINSTREILKKGILSLTPANEDSIGHDAVVVRKMWLSQNHLLNFHIRYYGNEKVHFINLVKKPGALYPEDQPVKLELRHNRNRDREVYPMSAFVSFGLDSIRIAGLDSVRFEVRAIDYDDKTHVFTGVYHY